MKTVLITRPEAEAGQIASLLSTQGFAAMAEPLLRIDALPDNKPLLDAALAKRPQAILATSRNAVRLLAEFSRARDIPLLCVGEATAQYAASLGFTIHAYGQTAQSLAEITAGQCAPGASLLYVRGEDIHFDLAAELKRKHLAVDSVTLYSAIAATEFSTELQKQIVEGAIAGALFFSQRTAEIYVGLAQKHGLTASHRILSAVAMSEAIATALKPLPWHGIHVAAKPDMHHMLQAAQDAF